MAGMNGFQMIPKTQLFTDRLEEAPAQVAYQNASVIDPTFLLLLSLFNNNNNNNNNNNYNPQPMYHQQNNLEFHNLQRNIDKDMGEVMRRLDDIKNLVMRQPRQGYSNNNQQPINYDDTDLYNLIVQNQDANWNKMLDIEAKILELQNEHYDIYNILNTTPPQESYYPPPPPVASPPSNNDYYDEYTTTTTEQYDDYYDEQNGDEYYDETYNDYYINKDNYKEFMRALKADIEK